MKKLYSAFIIILLHSAATAQVINPGMLDTGFVIGKGRLKIGGLVDTYYAYNFSDPADKTIPYLTSSARHNEFNINLAYLDLQYTSARVRARLTTGFGTYNIINYASEPIPLKFLLEANVGVKPFKKYGMWIDFGVLGSPYTNESYVAKDHLMYTRSLSCENAPYYLTGFKFSFPLHKKWNAYLYLLNGWQEITENNSGKAIGTQLEFRPDKKNLVNWNTYIGDEQSDSFPDYRARFFTDMYWIYNPDGKFTITSCAYIGVQMMQDTLGIKSNALWYTANVQMRYRFFNWFSLSWRVEYFKDEKSIFERPVTGASHFDVLSGGLCFNFTVMNNFMFRLDGRGYYGFYDDFYNMNGVPVPYNFQLTANATAWF